MLIFVLRFVINSKTPNGLALLLPRHNVELFHQTLVQHCCENISAVEDEKANQKIVKHIVQRRMSQYDNNSRYIQ